jgi:hypothetical protein
VARSTWAAALSPLTQLRVLSIAKEMLQDGHLVAEVKQLRQLQCVYVYCAAGEWDPAVISAEVGQYLQVLGQCSSLRAVLCYPVSGRYVAAQDHQVLMQAGHVHLSCWQGWYGAEMEGRVVCPRACPQLPGVWELQQRE